MQKSDKNRFVPPPFEKTLLQIFIILSLWCFMRISKAAAGRMTRNEPAVANLCSCANYCIHYTATVSYEHQLYFTWAYHLTKPVWWCSNILRTNLDHRLGYFLQKCTFKTAQLKSLNCHNMSIPANVNWLPSPPNPNSKQATFTPRRWISHIWQVNVLLLKEKEAALYNNKNTADKFRSRQNVNKKTRSWKVSNLSAAPCMLAWTTQK